MKTTHALGPKSTLRGDWAIENTTHAQQRLVVALRDARTTAPLPTRPVLLVVGMAMLLLGNDRSGCLELPLSLLVEVSGASRPSVERSVRGLEELGLLRREPGAPGTSPTYRWLRPVADRVLKNASAPRRTPIWLRGGIPAVASDSAEPESSVRLRELEPVATAPAAALWSQIEAHDVRSQWLEVYAGWRARTLQIHAKPREPGPATWAVLGEYAALFGAAEQRRALELTCQAWPEVASDKVKSTGYPLAWLEHDLAALEPRVRRALAVAAQRGQRSDDSTATSSPVTPDERRQLARAVLGALNGGRAA